MDIFNYKISEESTSDPIALRQSIVSAIAGKQTAQRQLYDQWAPVLYGLFRRYIKEEANAQDILSETFVTIFRKLHKYSFEGSFEGWLRTIAVRAVTDYFRKNQKHIDAARTDPEAENPAIENHIISKISYKELLQCIHELPEPQRIVFNLFVFEEYAHKEIASLLNITETTSRWYVTSARRRLREKINSMF